VTTPMAKYKDDPALSWEARYQRLLAHHEQQTALLRATIDHARAQIDYNVSDQGWRAWLARFFRRSPFKRCNRILHAANMRAWRVLAGFDVPPEAT